MIKLHFFVSKEAFLPKRVIALPYSNIFNNILDGFDIQLGRLMGNNYDHQLKVVEISNDDALNSIVEKTNQDKVGFPFFGRKFNSLDERQQYNAWLFRQQGVTYRNKAGDFFVFQLLPVNIATSVYFLCNNRTDLRLYAQRWFDACKMRYLSFDVEIEGIPIRIRVEPDSPNFTFPDFQTGSDVSDIYNVETSVTIHAFIGSVSAIKPITKYNVKCLDTQGNELLAPQTYDAKPDGLYQNNQKLDEDDGWNTDPPNKFRR